MKYHILLLLFVSFLLHACDDSNEQQGQGRSELKLTASADNIILDRNHQDEVALTISWNKATEIGSEYTFDYLFQIDIADNDFASATDYVTLGENESYSYTAAQLYDLIVEKWGQTPGETVTIEARVAAKVNGPKFVYPEIATANIQVTTFVLESMPLYMLGTATAAGLDPSKAVRMEEISNGRLYQWAGKLNPGNFKFISVLGSMLPSYNREEKIADNNFSLVLRTDESEPDDYFEITEAGTYYINLSLKDMTVNYQLSKYDALYIVGDGCSLNYSNSITTPMQQDKTHLNIFTYVADLITSGEGTFKIYAGTRWEDLAFRPMVANAPVEDGPVQAYMGDPDLKWKVTADMVGRYLITLDVDAMTIKFEKQQ